MPKVVLNSMPITNTKSIDDYAGSGAFLMLLEAKMNYKREYDNPVGELYITNRDDASLNYFVRLDEQNRPYRVESNKSSDDPFLMQNIKLLFGHGRSLKDAFDTYKKNGGIYKDRAFRNLVEALVAQGKLVVKEEGAGSKPTIYAQVY